MGCESKYKGQPPLKMMVLMLISLFCFAEVIAMVGTILSPKFAFVFLYEKFVLTLLQVGRRVETEPTPRTQANSLCLGRKKKKKGSSAIV